MNKAKQVITGILALIIMVMVIIPCADGCDNNSHNKEHSIQTAQEHHEQHGDVCSPFCSCSCCSVQVTIVRFPVVSFLTPESTQEFSVFKEPFVSSFFSSVWQPPKIS